MTAMLISWLCLLAIYGAAAFVIWESIYKKN